MEHLALLVLLIYFLIMALAHQVAQLVLSLILLHILALPAHQHVVPAKEMLQIAPAVRLIYLSIREVAILFVLPIILVLEEYVKLAKDAGLAL